MGLKQIYRGYLGRLKQSPQNLRLKKQYVSEWLELVTTQWDAVQGGSLTRGEKKQIQTYWKTHYGKKIPLFWHRKYKAYSGKLDAAYFPEILYTTKLEPKKNPDAIASVLGDKNLTAFLFQSALEKTPWLRIPRTIGGCANGFCFDGSREPISEEKLIENLCVYTGHCVIKPTVGESAGNGVALLDLDGGTDRKSGKRVHMILKAYGKNFVLQEVLQEHRTWSAFHPTSLNTVRIITYRVNGEIHIGPAVLRMGRNGSFLDNAHAGGIYVAVDKHGNLGAYALGSGLKDRTACHPDTGISFHNYQIPYMDRVREAAQRLHGCLPHMGFVNWDLAADQEGNVCLIEANLSCGSIWLFQNAHGRGVFGEDTPEMLALLRGS